MKTINFMYAAMALLASVALSSCQKEQEPANPDAGLKSVALSLNFGQTGTKTVEDDLKDPWTTDYSEYESLDIYFTNGNGDILYYYHATESASGNGGVIWNYLVNTQAANGVRFIGMEGISKVYVVANGPEISDLSAATNENGVVTTGDFNIDDLNAALTLTSYTVSDEQDKMLYAGAAASLTSAGTINTNNTGEIVVGEDATGQYYKATVTIRPALSRLEVSQAGVKTKGYVYFKVDDGGNYVETTEAEATLRVEYEDFTPSLVGVYASNVYRTAPLFPVQTDVTAGNLFATPTFEGATSPIEDGSWTDLANEAELNNYLCYANSKGSGAYDPLVSDTYSGTAVTVDTENDGLLLFDGKKNASPETAYKVIPFNFFVPYDITDIATDVDALEDAAVPALHFQFHMDGDAQTAFKESMVVTQRTTAGTGEWTEVTEQSTIDAVTAQVEWPTTATGEPGIGFANVVNYSIVSVNGEPVQLKPGMIYRVQQVIVDPTNISVSTKDTDAYNVYVVVTVVPYTEENVYPVFD